MHRKYSLLALPTVVALIAGVTFVSKACEKHDKGDTITLKKDLTLTDVSQVQSGRSDGLTKQAEDNNLIARVLAPMIAAGIDPKSETAVIKALSHENRGVKYAAIFLVGRRREHAAIPVLKSLLGDKSSSLRLRATQALFQIGDVSWKPSAIELLNDADPLVYMQAAQLLAKNGDARGWELVKKHLLDPASAYFSEAAFKSSSFDGLEIGEGKEETKIDVLETIVPIFAASDETNQTTLVGVILKSANKSDVPILKKLIADVKSEKSTYNKDGLTAFIKELEFPQVKDKPASVKKK